MCSSFPLDIGSNKILALSLNKINKQNQQDFIAFLLVFVLCNVLWDYIEMEENVQLL